MPRTPDRATAGYISLRKQLVPNGDNLKHEISQTPKNADSGSGGGRGGALSRRVAAENAGDDRRVPGAHGVGAAEEVGASERAAGAVLVPPVPLTDGERRSYRMGVIAAGVIYVDCVNPCCRSKMERLRIAIAARGVDCAAPEFWPARGGQ